MRKYSLFGWLILIIAALAGYFILARADIQSDAPAPSAPAVISDRLVEIEVQPEMTFSLVAETAGLDKNLVQELLTVSSEVYDLSKIRVGRTFSFFFSPDTGELKKFIYPLDSEEELWVDKNAAGGWQARREKIAYDIKLKTVAGTIENSLYESAVSQGVDIRAIIALADVFAWSIDFGMGIRQGDTYKFIFEERYREGVYVLPGQILAARFVNDGKVVEGYYFSEGMDEEGETIDGYYHPDGQSVQKIFLKNPVSYKYISSGYTSGLRYISAFDISTGHRAIDYAAASGSPVRTVGEGQVISAGWNKQGYGNFISIRHNETFSTNYAHLSKIYVRRGQWVQQSDIIGAVGSTGLSTGPHLHFEMLKYGTKINPLTVDLPSDKAVSPEKMEEFKKTVEYWQTQLL